MRVVLCAVLAFHAQTTFGCVIKQPNVHRLVESSSAIFAGILVAEDTSRREAVPDTLTVFQTFTVDVRRTWVGKVAKRVVVSNMDVHEQCVGSRADVKDEPGLFAAGNSIIIFARDEGAGFYSMLPFGYSFRFNIFGNVLLPPESLFEVEIREIGIPVTAPDGTRQSVPWSDLRKVVLRTTDDGPGKPNIFWDLYTEQKAPAATFPSGSTGEDRFLWEIDSLHRRLAGQTGRWDRLGEKDAMLLKAATSRSSESFVVWEAPRSEGTINSRWRR
jgi:hypothetical protein